MYMSKRSALIKQLFLIILLGCAVKPAFAQENLLLRQPDANAKAAKQKSANVSALQVQYDKFKNQTNFGVNAVLERRFDDSGVVPVAETVQMLIGGSYAGTTPKAPPTVVIFLTAARSPLFGEKAELTAAVDGQSFNFGTAFDYAATKQNKLFGAFGGYRESIRFVDVPFDKFAKFAQGQKVEIRVGKTEFVLDSETLTGYRQILSHVGYAESERDLSKRQNASEKLIKPNVN